MIPTMYFKNPAVTAPRFAGADLDLTGADPNLSGALKKINEIAERSLILISGQVGHGGTKILFSDGQTKYIFSGQAWPPAPIFSFHLFPVEKHYTDALSPAWDTHTRARGTDTVSISLYKGYTGVKDSIEGYNGTKKFEFQPQDVNSVQMQQLQNALTKLYGALQKQARQSGQLRGLVLPALTQ